MSDYGYTVEVPEGYDEAILRTRLAMKGQGFSIISEMHVGGMLGSQAGDERQYLIMGMWNSALSQRQIDPQLKAAVHLPCNVVVQERERGALVAAFDPVDVVEGADDATLASAALARDALERMLRLVAAAAG